LKLLDRTMLLENRTLHCLFVAYALAEVLFNTTRVLRPYIVFVGIVFVLLHSLANRGTRYTMLFFSIAFSFTLASELGGTAFGWVFGKYYYAPRPPWMIAELVPIQNPLSWCVVLYVCDALTDLVLPYDPNRTEKVSGRFLPLAVFAIEYAAINGLEAVGLDMILDPISAGHSWYWATPGPYFGIPLSNYLGWFVVTVVSTGAARVIGSSRGLLPSDLHHRRVFESAPILLYALFLAEYSFAALFGWALAGEGRPFSPELVLVGFSTMVPYIMIATLNLHSRRRSRLVSARNGKSILGDTMKKDANALHRR